MSVYILQDLPSWSSPEVSLANGLGALYPAARRRFTKTRASAQQGTKHEHHIRILGNNPEECMIKSYIMAYMATCIDNIHCCTLSWARSILMCVWHEYNRRRYLLTSCIPRTLTIPTAPSWIVCFGHVMAKTCIEVGLWSLTCSQPPAVLSTHT